MRTVQRCLAVVLAVCLLPGPASAARKQTLELDHQRLDLPGIPYGLIPADLDRDGVLDLLVVLAYTELQSISEDRIEDLVQVTTVIPAILDRRELHAYLAAADGTLRAAGALELPRSVISIVGGDGQIPAMALTDRGVEALRYTPGGASPLRFELLIEERPVLAGSGTYLSSLEWVADLNLDGRLDVLFPGQDGPAVFLGGPDGMQTSPVQRLRFPGDRTEHQAGALRHYPWPKVSDLNGDGAPDLHSNQSRVEVFRGRGDGTFVPLYDEGDCPAQRAAMKRSAVDGPSTVVEGIAFLGDIDGDGRAEAVTIEELSREGGMRAGLKDAKRPRQRFRFFRLRDDLRLEADPYQELVLEGHIFGDAESGAAPLQQFQDLDGDGRLDLITVTLEFSMFQLIKIMATKRIGVGLNFHVWAQDASGIFREVPDLDLSEKMKFNLRNLQLGKFAQFAGDFDGDGRADFVHLGRGRTVTIHSGRAGCRYPSRPDLVLARATVARPRAGQDRRSGWGLSGRPGRNSSDARRTIRDHTCGATRSLPLSGGAMTRRWFAWLVLACTPCLAQSQPPEPGVHHERTSDGIRIDVRLAGPLLSVATPLRDDGSRSVLLLTGTPAESVEPAVDEIPAAPCEEPQAADSVELWQLRWTAGPGAAELDRVRTGLPSDSTAIEAVDLDGDGIDELVLARPGQLIRLPHDTGAPPRTLIEDPALSVSDPDRSIFHLGRDGAAWVLATDVGRTRFYRSVRGTGEFVTAAEIESPTSVSMQGQEIRIRGGALTGAGLVAEGHPRFATTPGILDGYRVRTDLIDPLAAGSEVQRAECWARLPGREQALEQFVRVLDGDPVVLLTTMPAGKLNLFGEKFVRILPLRPDRSRTGHAPLLATSSRMNLWQMVTPHILDVNADGNTDLVLGYWKGLKDARVVLDVYPRGSDGVFSDVPRSTAFNVDEGDRSGLTYGEDLTGDGVADLLLRGGGNLLVFSGEPGLKQIVSKKPSHSVSLGWACEDQNEVEVSIGTGTGPEGTFQSVQVLGRPAAPRLVDLDGDGTSEVLVVKSLECGSGRAQLFFLDPAPRP